MKKIASIILVFTLIGSSSKAQNLADSVSHKICETLEKSKEKDDSVRIAKAFIKHLGFLKNYETKEADSLVNKIYYRLQFNCSIFKDILTRLAPESKDWTMVDEKPVSKVSAEECAEFYKHTDFRYVEMSGDTVHLAFDKNFWIDHFKDGTYSKLNVVKQEGCQFAIEFIESNNEIRKNLSNPGDRYTYTILEKGKNYYVMSAEVATMKRYALFKLYFWVDHTKTKQ